MKSPVHPFSSEGQEELERRRALMRICVGITCVIALVVFGFQVRSTVTTTISPEEYQGLTEANTSGIQEALSDVSETTDATGEALGAVLEQVDAGLKQEEATRAVFDELSASIDAVEVESISEEGEQP